jgi:hypothetical protein
VDFLTKSSWYSRYLFILAYIIYLNYKQADNEFFSIILYKLDYIINKKKTTYSNIVFIILIKENLSCFLIIYTWFINIFLKLILDQFLFYRLYDYKIVLESDKKNLFIARYIK